MSPATRIDLTEATSPYFAGVDVGGTNIKLGVVDNLGRVCSYRSIPTREEAGPEAAMSRAASNLREMCEDVGLAFQDVVAVGLATPGTMDIRQGILLHPHNLPNWWNFPIQKCLADEVDKLVSFANDANAAAYGEFWVGSGSDFHSICLFTLGTGVGGGTIIGDLSIDGENSAGSELGHTIIDFNDTARMCGCGQRGHLEAYASGKAVVQRAQETLEGGQASSLNDRIAGGEELTPLMVAQEAEKEDAVALQLVMDTATYLAVGAVNAMHVIDPGAVIFGGAMNFGGHKTDLGRRFLGKIKEEIVKRAFPVLGERTHIDFASLGSDAGFIGAAGTARTLYLKSSS